MSRRAFLSAIAVNVLTASVLLPAVRWSRGADLEQKRTRLGYAGIATPSSTPVWVNALWKRLAELGYVEGQNLVVERRWAGGHYERFPALMSELVESKVDIIVTAGTPGAIAAKKATSTIPIVAVAVGDPVRTGLVESLARPGGNLTGMSMGFAEGLSGKWLELLQEAVPRLSAVAVIANTDNPINRELAKDIAAVAPSRHLKIRTIEVRDAEALDSAFRQARRQAQSVLLIGDAVTITYRQRVAALATKYHLPVVYNMVDFVQVGGLMAYAADLEVMYRRAAEYVVKILDGAKPADLPIEQPTRYTLVINLPTAKALGLPISESILLRADEVIR